jgi:PTS system nitrogen regulatory IIA component
MYLNVIQLAESLGVEEQVIRGWIRTDGLPAIQDRGRLLFDRAQVTEWAANRGLAAKAGFLAPTAATASARRSLESFLQAGGIWRNVSDPIPVFEQVLVSLPGATGEVRRILTTRLRATNGITWAPVGDGLALPHLRSHVTLGRDAGLLALLFLSGPLRLAEPVPDGRPVTHLFFFVAPSPRAHLEMLAQLSGALTRGSLRKCVLAGESDQQILECLRSSAPIGSAQETS